MSLMIASRRKWKNDPIITKKSKQKKSKQTWSKVISSLKKKNTIYTCIFNLRLQKIEIVIKTSINLSFNDKLLSVLH